MSAKIRGKKRKDGFPGRHRDSRLCHHAQQANGLERDRFAAGIRPADDQLPLFLSSFYTAELERHWNDGGPGARAFTQPLLEQRMARADQREPAGAGRGKLRTHAVKAAAKRARAWSPSSTANDDAPATMASA